MFASSQHSCVDVTKENIDFYKMQFYILFIHKRIYEL